MIAPGARDLCVATCYLAHDAGVVAFLNDLAGELRHRGVELLVLATAESPDLEALQLHIPYDLAGFDAQLSLETPPPFHDAEHARHGDAAWTGILHPPELIARGVAKCEWFYRELARLLTPCAALIWNNTLPHGRIARNTLHAQGVPAYCFERGQLPASYQLQTFELNAWNDLACSFPLQAGLVHDLARQRDDAFDAARLHYLATGRDRYATTSHLDRALLDARYGTAGKTVVVLFGSAAGSSLMPPCVPSVAYGQPLWQDMGEMLDAFDEALGPRDDIAVVFQDHPINRTHGLSPPLPERFIGVEGVPVRRLLELADRVGVLGTSTVQYEAALLDKPLLLFGRGPLAQAGAAYSAVDLGLPTAVMRWLDDADGEHHRRNARALVGLLCERHLVRQGPGASHIEHGAAHLADFLAGFKRARAQPLEQRLQCFFDSVLAACHLENCT